MATMSKFGRLMATRRNTRPMRPNPLKIAINGFGRISRVFLRVAFNLTNLDIVAINDLTDSKTLAHLLKYDSVHGKFNGTVTHEKDALIINGKRIRITAGADPSLLPWAEMGIDVVIESTGHFLSTA